MSDDDEWTELERVWTELDKGEARTPAQRAIRWTVHLAVGAIGIAAGFAAVWLAFPPLWK